MKMLGVAVLKKERLNKLIKEFKSIGMSLIILLIVFQIVFYKENIFVTFRTVISLFFAFVIPGYLTMFNIKQSLGFLEKFVIGTILSFALIGSVSYLLGISGLNIKYHIGLPLLIIIINIIIILRGGNEKEWEGDRAW